MERLKSFVTNTNTAQNDASIVLIQRIAGKLDLLTQEEKDLIAAQELFKREQEDVNIKTTMKKQEIIPKPYLIKGENKNEDTTEAEPVTEAQATEVTKTEEEKATPSETRRKAKI